MLVLVINCGSSSVKYQLIETEKEDLVCVGSVERIGAVTSIVKHHIVDKKPLKETTVIEDHNQALKAVMDFILNKENKLVGSVDDIKAVGHRVVHGGESFKDSVLIDESVIEAIEQAIDLAPLHNPPNLSGIEAARKHLPDVPHVAVFDTAFHQTLSPDAYLYGIPNRMYRKYRIRKYGFHGTSHYFVSRRYYRITGKGPDDSKLITCHLGNGSSIAAIKNGDAVDTSMGFTPLSGLIMGTRSGDIDPSILFYLVEKEELSLNNLHALLNRHSGLLGMSGYASDMQDLLEEAKNGDKRCAQAVSSFCYRIRQFIGSYFAVMNGCNALIFTAGIGENSPDIREGALKNLDAMGIELDHDKNRDASLTGERKISTDNSEVDVYVIPTNEELVIAIDAAKIATAYKQSPWI